MNRKIQVITAAALMLVATGLRAQTLTLDSCIAIARRNNANIRTSMLEIERAREVKRQVFTKYFPQVQARALGYVAADPLVRFGIDDVQSADMRDILQSIYELVVESGNNVENEVTLMKRGASTGAMAVQPIFAGRRIVTGNRLANLGVEAAELQSQVQMRDVEEAVESTFYLVVGLTEKEATVSAALSLIDSLDRTVQTALANGLVTKSDALQVQLKRNEMMAKRQQLASGIRLSKRLLCSQMGIDYSDSIDFVNPETIELPPLEYRYAAQGDSLRPETRLLALAVEAERLNRRMTLGEALPQITLVGTAFYGNLIKQESAANAVVLLSLSVPLSSWWETSHRLRQHDIRIQEATIKQEHLKRMMSIEEEKAYSDMVDAYMLIRSDSSALDIASENYRIANLNYQAGANTLSDVLQAHTLLLSAQNAVTDRRITYIMSRRRLSDLQKQR